MTIWVKFIFKNKFIGEEIEIWGDVRAKCLSKDSNTVSDKTDISLQHSLTLNILIYVL